MKLPPDEDQVASFAARWTSRVALFSASILVAGCVLHRLLSIPTSVALNLIILSMLGAIASLILGGLATIHIWRHGSQGVPRVITGAFISIVLLAWPLSQQTAYANLPKINDITTDWASPPPFVKLASLRTKDANPTQYPGETFATKQRKAYPDLKPLYINRPSVETFEIVADAMRRQGLTIVAEQRPGETANAPGLIEAYDRTLLMGYYDDVAVRIQGDLETARIDIRSASRYGRHDLGANAIRTRALLNEIVARLEATIPAARERAIRKKKKKKSTAKTHATKTPSPHSNTPSASHQT